VESFRYNPLATLETVRESRMLGIRCARGSINSRTIAMTAKDRLLARGAD